MNPSIFNNEILRSLYIKVLTIKYFQYMFQPRTFMINHDLKKVLFLKDQIKNKSLNIIRVAMLKKILFTEKVISNTGKNDFQYLQKLLHFCIYIRQKKSQKESNLRRWIEIIFLCLSNDWNTFNILWKREKTKTVSSYALFKVINVYDINRTNVNTA